MAPIKHITSHSDFDSQLSSAANKLVVVDFHATWCGPCHTIAPEYELLAQQYSQAVFLKVDVDQVRSVAQAYSVSAMPTFLFIKNKKVVDQLKGANPGALHSLVGKHAGSTASAFSGSGRTLGGSSSSSSTSAATSSSLPSVSGIMEGHVSIENILPLLLLAGYLLYVFTQ